LTKKYFNFTGHLGGSVVKESAFGSGHDPRFLGSSPALGSLLSGEPASPSPPPLPHALSVSLSNKNLFKKGIARGKVLIVTLEISVT